MKDALSKLSNVQQTAMQLYGYGYYTQEQELLELALSEDVYRKGLPKNDKQLAELNLLLGRCYQAQSMMDQAANSYQEASKIYENIQHGSADAIKSLLILGIFQKESSDWAKARPILGQALTESRQFKVKATAAAARATASAATEREKEKAAENADLSTDLARQSTAAFIDLIKQMKLTKSPMVPEAEKFLAANSR
jgi:tetratricopeptide (TPR) repeat protein